MIPSWLVTADFKCKRPLYVALPKRIINQFKQALRAYFPNIYTVIMTQAQIHSFPSQNAFKIYLDRYRYPPRLGGVTWTIKDSLSSHDKWFFRIYATRIYRYNGSHYDTNRTSWHLKFTKVRLVWNTQSSI